MERERGAGCSFRGVELVVMALGWEGDVVKALDLGRGC